MPVTKTVTATIRNGGFGDGDTHDQLKALRRPTTGSTWPFLNPPTLAISDQLLKSRLRRLSLSPKLAQAVCEFPHGHTAATFLDPTYELLRDRVAPGLARKHRVDPLGFVF